MISVPANPKLEPYTPECIPTGLRLKELLLLDVTDNAAPPLLDVTDKAASRLLDVCQQVDAPRTIHRK